MHIGYICMSFWTLPYMCVWITSNIHCEIYMKWVLCSSDLILNPISYLDSTFSRIAPGPTCAYWIRYQTCKDDSQEVLSAFLHLYNILSITTKTWKQLISSSNGDFKKWIMTGFQYTLLSKNETRGRIIFILRLWVFKNIHMYVWKISTSIYKIIKMASVERNCRYKMKEKLIFYYILFIQWFI